MASLSDIIAKDRSGQSLTAQEQAQLAQARAQVRGAGSQPSAGGAFLSPPEAPVEGEADPGIFSRAASAFSPDLPPDSRNLPELGRLGVGLGPALQMLGGFALNADPAAREDIARNALGDRVQFMEDSAGNPLLEVDGQRAFINRPGLSVQDAVDVGADVLKFLPAAGVASRTVRGVRNAPHIGSKAWRLISRVLPGTYGANLATEAGAQKASQVFGSEQPVDWEQARGVGAWGTAGEVAMMPFTRFVPGARQIMKTAKRKDINLRDDPAGQALSLADRGREMADIPNRPMTPAEQAKAQSRGRSMKPLQREVQAAEGTARQEASAPFDEAARAGEGTTVAAEGMEELNERVMNVIENGRFDLESMPALRRHVEEIQKLGLDEAGEPTAADLNKLALRMRRMSQDSSKGVQQGLAGEQKAGMRQLYREMDDWMVEQFNRDMISGDPSAVEKWKTARAGWRQFQDNFNSSKVIRDLIHRKNATPEQMRQWIFNSADTPVKTEAGATVQQLKKILGADSDAMKKVQAEVATDIVGPLLESNPNLPQFIDNYEKFVQKAPTTAGELFGDGMGELDQLYNFAKGVVQRPGAQAFPRQSSNLIKDSLDWVNRYTIGHSLARAQARLQATGGVLRALQQNTAGRQGRNVILREYLGYDPKQPILAPGTGSVAGATSETGATPEEARQATSQVDLRFVIRKAQAGEALTNAEQNLLDQARRSIQSRGQDQPTGGEQRE